MNSLIFLACTLLMSLSALASECSYRMIESTGTVVVVPVYTAKAIYNFDNYEKKAFAQVFWNLNYEATKTCLKNIEALNPNYKHMIAAIKLGELKATVFKGLSESKLFVYPEASGHFNGSSDLILVDYKAKNEIYKAIKDQKPLIQIDGSVTYSVEERKKTVVTEIDCVKKEESVGVLNLHQRLGEVIKILNVRNYEEKVSRSDVLDDFMTNCVEFKEVEAQGAIDFNKGMVRKTKLVKGKIPVYGMKLDEVTVAVSAATVIEAQAVEF